MNSSSEVVGAAKGTARYHEYVSFNYSSQSDNERLSPLVITVSALRTGHPKRFFTVFTEEEVVVFEETD